MSEKALREQLEKVNGEIDQAKAVIERLPELEKQKTYLVGVLDGMKLQRAQVEKAESEREAARQEAAKSMIERRNGKDDSELTVVEQSMPAMDEVPVPE